jgi:hypothetical protein
MTLAEIMEWLWSVRKALCFGVAFGLICAAALLFVSIPQTRVQMLLAPASPLNNAGATSVSEDNFALLRFIARRAGVDNAAGFTRFEKTYSGVSVAREMMKDSSILPILKADRKWIFMRAENPESWSAEKLADYIGRRVSVNATGAPTIHAMQYWHPDPALGKVLLAKLHEKTDSLIRQSLQNEARQRIDYLTGQISNAVHPDHRRALTDLLLEQERLLMLASIEQPYAATIVENPFAHYKAGKPDPKLVLPAFAFAGMMLALLLHMLAGLRRHEA